ncbi:winged helix DNA-binding domain-containing protein [Janibacter sp. G349]|uniref:winged helix DNA-binding domain-containing protein n=1 Tax=Janibacter sp. G349 TaxID=3405424 RepID=UPI003B77B4DE
MRTVGDAERRARLATRHALHPDHHAPDVVGAARSVVCLHATEAATVHLAVGARTTGVTPFDVDTALYDDRGIVKQLAMRRTLFAFPRDLLPAALAVARERIAPEQHRLVARDATRHGIADDGAAWLETAGAAVERRLDGGEALPAAVLRADLPELSGAITINEGKRYGGTFNLAPRVLTWLGAQGRITRGPNAGHWRLSKPAWTLMDSWLGEEPAVPDLAAGYAELVRRWLERFGPGTTEDVQWWLGATKGATRAALADVGAVEVGLEGGATGWLLPDDLEPVAEVGPWAALLPTLDPTTMGWKARDWYLDPAHRELLFDSNGNGGTTAWWDGRIVGAWVQDDDGVVSVVECPGTDLGSEGRSALAVEAERLTAWLDGVRITNVYSSRLMKGQALP